MLRGGEVKSGMTIYLPQPYVFHLTYIQLVCSFKYMVDYRYKADGKT